MTLQRNTVKNLNNFCFFILHSARKFTKCFSWLVHFIVFKYKVCPKYCKIMFVLKVKLTKKTCREMFSNRLKSNLQTSAHGEDKIAGFCRKGNQNWKDFTRLSSVKSSWQSAWDIHLLRSRTTTGITQLPSKLPTKIEHSIIYLMKPRSMCTESVQRYKYLQWF